MKQDKMMVIMRMMYCCRGLKRGEGWRLGEIAQWSGVARTTTYRYLKQLVKMGVVTEFAMEYRGQVISKYNISKKGQKFYEDFMVI